LLTIHPELTEDVKEFLTVNGAISSRTSSLGTASSSVSNSITALAKEISDADAAISNQRKRFSGMISQ
jgi:argininosuccinate lyase